MPVLLRFREPCARAHRGNAVLELKPKRRRRRHSRRRVLALRCSGSPHTAPRHPPQHQWSGSRRTALGKVLFWTEPSHPLLRRSVKGVAYAPLLRKKQGKFSLKRCLSLGTYFRDALLAAARDLKPACQSRASPCPKVPRDSQSHRSQSEYVPNKDELS